MTGEVVYANYGLPDDYEALESLGVDVRGKIVIVRYGESFRGVKAKLAEDHGAKGLIIYSDPEDDGFVKGPVFPNGPWKDANGIQRGSIEYIFEYPGDPLTPGAPSTPGTPRLDPADATNLPKIPTTPISYGEAKPMLAGTHRTRGAGGVPGRPALQVPRRARPHGDAPQPRHRLRAGAREQRGRRDPRRQAPGGEGACSAGTTTAGPTAPTTTRAPGRRSSRWVAASAASCARGWRPDRTIVLVGLGRRGVRPARLDRVGRAAAARPAPRRDRLHQHGRRRRTRVLRRRGALARSADQGRVPDGARSGRGRHGVRLLDRCGRARGGPPRQRLRLHGVPRPRGRALARGRLLDAGRRVPHVLRRHPDDGALPRSAATWATRRRRG